MTDVAALNVLIVDDHEGMRALLRKVLERAGVGAVRDAASGAAGLALLAERPANLILVDQNMPEMDGAAFVARVRREGGTAKIVMITGHGEASYADAAREAGADAVLVKPISPSALLGTIEHVLTA
jgi:two-component system, chemotaxis family, chemotaxis protein CheY